MPKPPPGSQRAKHIENIPKISRLEKLKRNKIEPDMPENPVPHIVARLIEIGLTEATGMGPAPLSWQTIVAWQRSTAVTLLPWEARLMRHLSLAYLGELSRAESENCPPPWQREISHHEREADEASLRMVLG